MDDTPDTPESTDEAPPPEKAATPAPRKKPRRKWLLLPLSLILIPVLIFGLWSWVTLGYVYAQGDRAGYVQKLSKKGWLCKTWEGELAMVNLPGSVTPQMCHCTVRSDWIAKLLEAEMGRRVAVTYDEHRGGPRACLG